MKKLTRPLKKFTAGMMLGSALLVGALVATPAKASPCRIVSFGCLVCLIGDCGVPVSCHINGAAGCEL